MDDSQIHDVPKIYAQLQERCYEVGFTMPSDLYIGPLLRTLASSKLGGNFLELGTGMSLSLVWLIEGMDATSRITSLDYDKQLTDIALEYFGTDQRVKIVCQDGSQWVRENLHLRFDLVFADTWAGKYNELEEVLAMVKPGGFYIIDDMNEQPNWPEGHAQKANELVDYLDSRKDFHLVKMNWSTGVIVATKVA